MVLADNALPFGMREVVLTPIDDSGTLGTPVKLPASRTLSFGEAEDFTELRGDDKLQASRGSGPSVEFSLESGGISLDAWKTMSGGSVAEEGVAGTDLARRFSKKGYDNRPYFKAEGRAISDSGGDFHAVLYRCRMTGSLEGEMTDGEFWLSSGDGTAFPDASNDNALYDFVHYEVETPIIPEA